MLPPRTRGHPQCQQILMRATASGRLEGIIFLFCSGRQSSRRLVCVWKMQSEWRSERSRAGWKRPEARRHWHWFILQHLRGLGTRDAWSAPDPSRANTCTRKGVTCYELRDRKGTYYLQVLPKYQDRLVSRIMIPGIQQLVYLAVFALSIVLVDIPLPRGRVSRMMLYYNWYYRLC